MFAPFPTLHQDFQALQWPEAVGLGLPSHSQRTRTQETSLYFEQRNVSHLPGPGHLLPCQETTLQLCLASDLAGPVCRSLRDISSRLNRQSLQKVNLAFSFLPAVSYIYTAPCTIANLGGRNPWIARPIVPTAARVRPSPQPQPGAACRERSTKGNGTSPAAQAPQTWPCHFFAVQFWMADWRPLGLFSKLPKSCKCVGIAVYIYQESDSRLGHGGC